MMLANLMASFPLLSARPVMVTTFPPRSGGAPHATLVVRGPMGKTRSPAGNL